MKNVEAKGPTGGPGIDLRELWAMTLKRRWIVVTTTAAFLAVFTLVSFLTPPMFTAKGQILIEREPNILSFQEVFQIESFNDEYYQTQYKLLQSRALAAATIDRLRAAAPGAVTPVSGQTPIPITDRSARRRLTTELLDNLNIRPVGKTRLVQASFSSRDPKTAADTLNALFDAYIEMNIQRKYQATEQATDFLTNQIATIRSEIETNERALQDYGKEKNIIALSSSENTVIEKLGAMNRALTDAQIDRINKETFYNEIRVATPDYIPNALNNTLIQSLAEEYNRLYRDYVKRSETFLPEYPEIQSLKAELDQAKKALETETQAVINRAYTDFQAALKKEQALAGVFGTQRREAFQLNSNAIQYNSLLIQIQNQKSLLESLMTRKAETDVSSRLKGLRTSNIWIVDKAEIPMSPSSPKKARNMVLGLMLGLFFGLGLALLIENLDNTVKETEDIRKYAGVPLLGVIPTYTVNGRVNGQLAGRIAGRISGRTNGRAAVSREEPADPSEGSGPAWTESAKPGSAPAEDEHKSMDLIVHFSPDSIIAENYRSIRTTLLFSSEAEKLRGVAVTSPLPEEGKTATTCNLAVAMAQAGKRVVVVDADLRKPRLHKVFRVKNLNGLTKYLSGDLALEDLWHATPIPSLFLINSGPVPPNPLELLGSERMAELIAKLEESFDLVLVDSPPILPVSDALVLGTRLDGAILVVRWGRTRLDALKMSQERMAAHHINRLGVILNDAHIRGMEGYYGAYYSGYRRGPGA